MSGKLQGDFLALAKALCYKTVTIMKRRMPRCLLSVMAAVWCVAGGSSAQAALTLIIDLEAQTFEWVDGTSSTYSWNTGDPDATFEFGTDATANPVWVDEPRPTATGSGSVADFNIYLSFDDTAIEGLYFNGSSGPGAVTLAGTTAGPLPVSFLSGSFSLLGNLVLGTYVLPANQANWDGGVEVQVVPEPVSGALLIAGAVGGLALLRRRPSVSI